jgi:hypothetical protein
MSIAQTAIMASALKGGSSTPKSKPTSIADSIAQKPLQWLVVTGAVVYFGGKFIKKIIPSGENLRKEEPKLLQVLKIRGLLRLF